MNFSTFIILGIALHTLISIIFSNVIIKKINSTSFWKYFFISFFLSPIFALLIGILDAISEKFYVTDKSNIAQSSDKFSDKQLTGNQILIENDNGKRIKIYECELEYYFKNGWHAIVAKDEE